MALWRVLLVAVVLSVALAAAVPEEDELDEAEFDLPEAALPPPPPVSHIKAPQSCPAGTHGGFYDTAWTQNNKDSR